MKSLADAVASRNKILQAFEQAEAEEDPILPSRPVDFRSDRCGPHRRGDG